MAEWSLSCWGILDASFTEATTAEELARVGRAATVVVPAWRDYLDGKITREAALDRIVKGFAEKEKGGPTRESSAPSKPPQTNR